MQRKVIAISGQPGAGSTIVAKLLAHKLSTNFFSAGQLFKDLAKGTVKEQFYYNPFKKLCHQKNLGIPKFNAINDTQAASDLWKTEFGKSKDFHNVIDDLQLKLASQGNIVIEGKLALSMIKNSDLKIWLKASLSERAKRAAQRDGLRVEDVKKIILKRQEKERQEWKKIYGFDYWDQERDADVVIDTSTLSAEQIVDKIIQKLN